MRVRKPLTGAQIREIRLALDMSQARMGQRLDVTVTSISRWENGHVQAHPWYDEKIKTMAREIKGRDARKEFDFDAL